MTNDDDTLPMGARSFLFEPSAWRGSRHVQRMTYDERGRYLELLCEQWEHGSAPGSPHECAGEFGDDLAGWKKAWPKLIRCFTLRKARDRRANPKLDRMRRARIEFLRTQAAHGRHGATKRWGAHGHPRKASHGHPIGSTRARHSLKRKEIKKVNKKKDLSTNGVRTPEVRTHTPPRARARERAINGRASLAAPKGFDRFFEIYPKREAKADALKAWKALKPDDALTRKIFDAIAWQRHKADWIREGGRYVPLPAKWLRDSRFNDQPPDTPHLSDATMKVLRAGAEFENS